jgi:GNAT superfamily N-acetyltransferase
LGAVTVSAGGIIGLSEKVTIIDAGHHHIPAIVEVWTELMDHHSRLDPIFEYKETGPDQIEAHLRELTGRDDAKVIVAVSGGRVIGFTLGIISKHPPVLVTETYGLVSDIAVVEAFRRRGIGGRMLEKVIGWFEETGIDRVELRVSPKNTIGYSFWEKHGFKDYLHVLYRV